MSNLFDIKMVFTQIPDLLTYLPVTLELAVVAMIVSLCDNVEFAGKKKVQTFAGLSFLDDGESLFCLLEIELCMTGYFQQIVTAHSQE